MNKTRTSKFLSLVLRHKPEIIGISPDKEGWVSTNILLNKLKGGKYEVSLEELKKIVETNNKKRFKFSEDFSKIRASQGHSIDIDIKFKKEVPPFELYHGTVEKNIGSIKKSGLNKGGRHHIHLSKDKETATNVGSRRGEPIILTIKARAMNADGYDFYISDNGVWLSDRIPPQYIEFPDLPAQ